MARQGEFRVVVATDGSSHARTAVAATLAFPWPDPSRARGVLARGPAPGRLSAHLASALEQGNARVAADTARLLQRRWADAEVGIVDDEPVAAIAAQSANADTVVVGSRGLGKLGRAVLGSVSRGVIRRVTCPVLVVKQRPRGARIGSLVIGVDGSPNSRRAVAYAAGLSPAPGARVVLVAAVERLRVQSLGLMPASIRSALARELAETNAEREAAARKEMESAAGQLEKAGWTVTATLRNGPPVDALVAAAGTAKADVLVVGARGTGGVARLLLGSVAEGVLDRSPTSVLIVR
jgi:nucleotide-binding universal stress UspA family protein